MIETNEYLMLHKIPKNDFFFFFVGTKNHFSFLKIIETNLNIYIFHINI